MDYLEIIKVTCLFLAILFTLINSFRAYYKENLPAANFIWQAIGITGFVYLQWLS